MWFIEPCLKVSSGKSSKEGLKNKSPYKIREVKKIKKRILFLVIVGILIISVGSVSSYRFCSIGFTNNNKCDKDGICAFEGSECDVRFDTFTNYLTLNNTYVLDGKLENKDPDTKTMEYEWFVCRCQEHLGNPPGECFEYWPDKIYNSNATYLDNCLGLGKMNETLGPLEKKNISVNVTQYANGNCGLLKVYLHLYEINGSDTCGRQMSEGKVDLCKDCEDCVCGNGIVEEGEECDDGNLINGDGCEADCKNPLQYECLIPDSLNDITKENIQPDRLQNFLNSENYSVNVLLDQKNYQIWKLDSESVALEITFLGKVGADYSNVFGYYINNISNFTGLFRQRDHSEFLFIPESSPGDKANVNLTKNHGDFIGFGIASEYLPTGYNQRYYTENNYNADGKDHAISFYVGDNTYVIAFEDRWNLGDFDYEDIIAEIKILSCYDIPEPYCGDGNLDAGEFCDDGNLIDGDGCNADCTVERNCESNITIYQDATQRSWYPNDQTIYTAMEYGVCDTNLYGDEMCVIDERGNYVFAGETLSYYVIVEDLDGDGIESVVLNDFGGCVEIDSPEDSEVSIYTKGAYSNWGDYAKAKFGVVWDTSEMELYRCKLIVGDETGEQQIKIDAEDEKGCNASDIKEYIVFNPPLNISVGGSVDFGSVSSGSIATSKDPIRLINEGGAVMDMYVASDDYFIDPDNEEAICGDSNGIKYDKFSYYATKGSLNSGGNDNSWFGLGEDSVICTAREDEFTPLPSHSGHIGDMCRVINHGEDSSFLNGGDYMSLLFRLDIPNPCEGAFTEGKFHFVGRAV